VAAEARSYYLALPGDVPGDPVMARRRTRTRAGGLDAASMRSVGVMFLRQIQRRVLRVERFADPAGGTPSVTVPWPKDRSASCR